MSGVAALPSSSLNFDRAVSTFDELYRRLVRSDLSEAISTQENESEREFSRLVARWKEDHLFDSSMTAMILDPSYQRIIALGQQVLPQLLRELFNTPNYWFAALTAITGVDPVPASHRGDLMAMRRDWLEWARINRVSF